jgi:hypothetical protein
VAIELSQLDLDHELGLEELTVEEGLCDQLRRIGEEGDNDDDDDDDDDENDDNDESRPGLVSLCGAPSIHLARLRVVCWRALA